MTNKSSREVRQSKIRLISELLNEWQSDSEIIKMLKIPHTTYYRYKQQVYKNDAKLLDKIRTGEIEHRQLQIRKALEYCITVNKDIAENSKDDRARIEASAMIVKAQMGLLNLATQPTYNEQIKIIHKDVTDRTNELENKVLDNNQLDNEDSTNQSNTNTQSDSSNEVSE